MLQLCNHVLVENRAVTGTWVLSVHTAMDMFYCSGREASSVTDLPHSNDGVCDEDKKDDERLHKGGDGLLALLEPGQHLEVRAAKIKSVAVDLRKHMHLYQNLCLKTPFNLADSKDFLINLYSVNNIRHFQGLWRLECFQIAYNNMQTI